MILGLLSSRLRSWLLLAVLLPVAGKVLRALGARVGRRSERAGAALTKAGELAQRPSRKQRSARG